jgi:hypothetical protein
MHHLFSRLALVPNNRRQLRRTNLPAFRHPEPSVGIAVTTAEFKRPEPPFHCHDADVKSDISQHRYRNIVNPMLVENEPRVSKSTNGNLLVDQGAGRIDTGVIIGSAI